MLKLKSDLSIVKHQTKNRVCSFDNALSSRRLWLNDCVLMLSGFTFGLMTMVGSWSAPVHFTLTMPCPTFRSYWLMKMYFPQKQVKSMMCLCCIILHSTPVSALSRIIFKFSFSQVLRFQQASSFWSRRCFCCCSGLWLTFIGVITVRHLRSVCTPTSTLFSHTWPSSAGCTPCWSLKILSHCRTSSLLWHAKNELWGQAQFLKTQNLKSLIYLFVTACCLSPFWVKLNLHYSMDYDSSSVHVHVPFLLNLYIACLYFFFLKLWCIVLFWQSHWSSVSSMSCSV